MCKMWPQLPKTPIFTALPFSKELFVYSNIPAFVLEIGIMQLGKEAKKIGKIWTLNKPGEGGPP